jgi:hypothetical protein
MLYINHHKIKTTIGIEALIPGCRFVVRVVIQGTVQMGIEMFQSVTFWSALYFLTDAGIIQL